MGFLGTLVTTALGGAIGSLLTYWLQARKERLNRCDETVKLCILLIDELTQVQGWLKSGTDKTLRALEGVLGPRGFWKTHARDISRFLTPELVEKVSDCYASLERLVDLCTNRDPQDSTALAKEVLEEVSLEDKLGEAIAVLESHVEECKAKEVVCSPITCGSEGNTVAPVCERSEPEAYTREVRQQVAVETRSVEVIDPLLEYSKAYYADRLSDFRDLDAKANGLLNAVAVATAFALAWLSFLVGNGTSLLGGNKLVWVWILLALGIVTVLIFAITFISVLCLLRSVTIDDIPSPEEFGQYYDEYKEQGDVNRLKEVIYCKYANASREYIRVNTRKSKQLSRANLWFRLGIGTFAGFLFVGIFVLVMD